MHGEESDEDEYITEEAFMAGLAQSEEALQSVLNRLYGLLTALEARVNDEDAHDCPEDHQVFDALHNARTRLTETQLWLKHAAQVKLSSGHPNLVIVPPPVPEDPSAN
jgi:hypothetical protein